MVRLRDTLINCLLGMLLLVLLLVVCVLGNVYTKTMPNKSIEYYNEKCAEYKMLAAKYRMDSAKMEYDVNEARLKAFVKAYSKGSYILEDEQ